ncbi:MAG: hypothetical protein H6R18_2835 [Proteobacteria bacterium]|nr:hypothetical protein [Pseudomonadota bacterium]
MAFFNRQGSMQKFYFLLVFLTGQVFAQGIPVEYIRMGQNFEEDYEAKTWQEIAVQLPLAPKPEKLVAVYVSAATEHHFFVDPDSISIGKDGVVRYTLAIKTSGGASNISFDGMRCETRERRSYAFGRSDGSWSRARSNEWVKIREETINRHHAALFTDFFCPGGVIAGSVKDIRYALLNQQGGKPNFTIGK